MVRGKENEEYVKCISAKPEKLRTEILVSRFKQMFCQSLYENALSQTIGPTWTWQELNLEPSAYKV